ncbi:protease Do-like 7 [Rutidosis leptorrhynchoides]|uniref:protease Do-like 7 n=1 Tax=Rutidosis leptorrhynchoides TaxID=125765 RepID=UPI003A994BC5
MTAQLSCIDNQVVLKVLLSSATCRLTLKFLDLFEVAYVSWDGYNDFNTFYIQAASGTKGGSSGSPVIDCQGRAVVLNAGANSSSSAYYYPLERVVRALNILQKGRYSCHDKWEAVVIPRGTLQATFLHKRFEETRRLCLQSKTEQVVRDASPLTETGMLVVDSVVPGGPAFNHLKSGDVLVRMNGQVITRFLMMEIILDDSVGDNVELEFERRGTPFTDRLMTLVAVLLEYTCNPNFINFYNKHVAAGQKVISRLCGRVLEVELYPIFLYKAKTFGLSDNWIQALVKKDPVRHLVLGVKGCLAGSKAENLLEEDDMVLAIDKKPVTCFNDIDDACNALDDDMEGKLELTIFRQGREIEIRVGTDIRDGNGTTRVINWCGCYVQDPHPEVRALGFLPEEGHGVYISRRSSGSPVCRYGLDSDQWIVEVNGKSTPNLDAFVNVTKEIEDGEFVHARTVELNGKPKVLTLKQNLHYWPTWELRCDPETSIWHRKIIKS